MPLNDEEFGLLQLSIEGILQRLASLGVSLVIERDFYKLKEFLTGAGYLINPTYDPELSNIGPRDYWLHLKDSNGKSIACMDTCADVIESLIGEGKDSRDLSKWDLVSTLPMKFNRCVLFRPWLWHRSGTDFGTSVENGRLIQLLFFEPAPNARGAARAPGVR